MLPFLNGALTVILVLDCLFLILLVLVQLPKKEAGAGMAFGGAATDALFGAGSGNVLTKITKYATIVFFVITLLLAILSVQQRKGGAGLKDAFGATKSSAPALPLSSSVSNSAPVTAPVTTPNTAAPSAAPAASTNAPAK